MTAQTFSDIPARAINERDRALLGWLAAVKIGSENQLIRHFWAATTASTAQRYGQRPATKSVLHR